MEKVPKLVGLKPRSRPGPRPRTAPPRPLRRRDVDGSGGPRARQPQQPSSQKRHPSAGSATSTTSIRTAIGTAKTLGRWHHSAYLGRQRLSVTAASAGHLCTTFNPQVEDRAPRPTPTRSIQQPARSLPAGGKEVREQPRAVNQASQFKRPAKSARGPQNSRVPCGLPRGGETIRPGRSAVRAELRPGAEQPDCTRNA